MTLKLWWEVAIYSHVYCLEHQSCRELHTATWNTAGNGFSKDFRVLLETSDKAAISATLCRATFFLVRVILFVLASSTVVSIRPAEHCTSSVLPWLQCCELLLTLQVSSVFKNRMSAWYLINEKKCIYLTVDGAGSKEYCVRVWCKSQDRSGGW